MIQVETQPLSQALHHVDAAAVRWVRVLNDPRWYHARTLDGSLPRTLRFSEHPHHPVKLRLKGDGAQLLVVLDEAQWPSLQVLKQMSDQPRRDALINLWAHQALSQLRDVGCKAERCHWDSEAQLTVAARVSVRLNGCLVDLYPESASDRFVDGLQTFLADLPVPLTTRLAQWPLASAVTLGERSFALSRIEALKVGDWVLWGMSDCVALRIHGAVSSTASGLVATCQLNIKELTMEEALHEEVPMVEAEAEDAEFLHSTYAGLQVNVRFEIDGPAMTVAQAIGLAPGEVLVLSTPVDQTRVRLRCQGRCFAYGELVNVGGQMGVRIVEVGGADVQPK
jgi:type III secretion system YscQ/HrcQ family protein